MVLRHVDLAGPATDGHRVPTVTMLPLSGNSRVGPRFVFESHDELDAPVFWVEMAGNIHRCVGRETLMASSPRRLIISLVWYDLAEFLP